MQYAQNVHYGFTHGNEELIVLSTLQIQVISAVILPVAPFSSEPEQPTTSDIEGPNSIL